MAWNPGVPRAFAAAAAATFALVAAADLGPKPSISVRISGLPVVPSVVASERTRTFGPSCNYENLGLLFCEDQACTRWREMRDAGPARFCCSEEADALVCGGISYGFAEWLRLRAVVDGRTVLSSVFRYAQGQRSLGFEARFERGQLSVAAAGGAAHGSRPMARDPEPSRASGGRPLLVRQGVGVVPAPRFDAPFGVLSVANASGEFHLDGVRYGTAPLELRLRPGQYHVAIRAPSGDLVEGNVEIRAGVYLDRLFHMRKPCRDLPPTRSFEELDRLLDERHCGNDRSVRAVPTPGPPQATYAVMTRLEPGGALEPRAAEELGKLAGEALRACYRTFYPDPQEAPGSISLELRLDARGSVQAVHLDRAGTTLADPEVHTCAVRAVEKRAPRTSAPQVAVLRATVVRTVPERKVPERTVQDRTVQDRTGPERTVQDRTGPERTGPDGTVPDR